MTSTERYAELGGRILLSVIFLSSGFGKIAGFAGTQGYMESAGVPGMLLPLVIALELLGAVALIVGYRTRVSAALLALFTLAAAMLFHTPGTDQIQTIMFMKNLAIAGGLLLLVARGAGDLSLDARRARPGSA